MGEKRSVRVTETYSEGSWQGAGTHHAPPRQMEEAKQVALPHLSPPPQKSPTVAGSG